MIFTWRLYVTLKNDENLQNKDDLENEDHLIMKRTSEIGTT